MPERPAVRINHELLRHKDTNLCLSGLSMQASANWVQQKNSQSCDSLPWTTSSASCRSAGPFEQTALVSGETSCTQMPHAGVFTEACSHAAHVHVADNKHARNISVPSAKTCTILLCNASRGIWLQQVQQMHHVAGNNDASSVETGYASDAPLFTYNFSDKVSSASDDKLFV